MNDGQAAKTTTTTFEARRSRPEREREKERERERAVSVDVDVAHVVAGQNICSTRGGRKEGRSRRLTSRRTSLCVYLGNNYVNGFSSPLCYAQLILPTPERANLLS